MKKYSQIPSQEMNKNLYLLNASIWVMLISCNKFEEVLRMMSQVKEKYSAKPVGYAFEYDVQFHIFIY